jgi:hypothetical protein
MLGMVPGQPLGCVTSTALRWGAAVHSLIAKADDPCTALRVSNANGDREAVQRAARHRPEPHLENSVLAFLCLFGMEHSHKWHFR